jgi:hypothetical protein
MKTRDKAFIISLLCINILLSCSAASQAVVEPVAIRGATVIDVSRFGMSTNDIPNATVLVRSGKIEALGPATQVRIPAGYHIVDATGSFLIPGLIDGFGALRTQGFADAYLSEGVTSVYVQLSPVGEDGEQTILAAAEGPAILRGGMIGGYSPDGTPTHDQPWTAQRLHGKRLSEADLQARVESLSSSGYRGLLAGMDIWPDQLDKILRTSKAASFATLGEMAFTTHPYAIRAGIGALIRSDRYQTAVDLAQDFLVYSDDPEGPGGAPGFRGVCASDLNSPLVIAFGQQLRDSKTALMPILSIEASADDLDIPNPWLDRAAKFVKVSDLDDPVDLKTGAHPYFARHTENQQKLLRQCAFHREDLDSRFYHLGAHFLAGSGTPAFGILPGAGLQLELSLLNRIGLTPREVLAAATNNFADIFGWTDRGKIEVGRRADLVLLSADPRTAVSALRVIRAVMLNGVFIPEP